MITLTRRQNDTLTGVLIHCDRELLNSYDITYLIEKKLICTAWSDYGLAVTTEGMEILEEEGEAEKE